MSIKPKQSSVTPPLTLIGEFEDRASREMENAVNAETQEQRLYYIERAQLWLESAKLARQYTDDQRTYYPLPPVAVPYVPYRPYRWYYGGTDYHVSYTQNGLDPRMRSVTTPSLEVTTDNLNYLVENFTRTQT